MWFGATALPGIGQAFAALSELPPAFLLSAIAGVLVSLADTGGSTEIQTPEGNLHRVE